MPRQQRIRINSSATAAVDQSYYWLQINKDTPRGVGIWLLTRYGRGIEGSYKDGDKDVIAWAPKPKIPDEIKELMK